MQLFKAGTKIDFMGKRKLAFVFSAVILLVAAGALVARGLSLGIDFTGGTLVELGYEADADIPAIRAVLEEEERRLREEEKRLACEEEKRLLREDEERRLAEERRLREEEERMAREREEAEQRVRLEIEARSRAEEQRRLLDFEMEVRRIAAAKRPKARHWIAAAAAVLVVGGIGTYVYVGGVAAADRRAEEALREKTAAERRLGEEVASARMAKDRAQAHADDVRRKVEELEREIQELKESKVALESRRRAGSKKRRPKESGDRRGGSGNERGGTELSTDPLDGTLNLD